MLSTRLTHPEILAALAGAGHGSQVLIADGNYPFATGANPAARRVYLNLARGFAPVNEVLAVLSAVIPIEAAHVMVPEGTRVGPEGTRVGPEGTRVGPDEGDDEPAIFGSFRDILPDGVTLQPLGRFAFYEAARGSDVALVIATGEERIYANILLTIGVVPPDAEASART